MRYFFPWFFHRCFTNACCLWWGGILFIGATGQGQLWPSDHEANSGSDTDYVKLLSDGFQTWYVVLIVTRGESLLILGKWVQKSGSTLTPCLLWNLVDAIQTTCTIISKWLSNANFICFEWEKEVNWFWVIESTVNTQTTLFFQIAFKFHLTSVLFVTRGEAINLALQGQMSRSNLTIWLWNLVGVIQILIHVWLDSVSLSR